jgi:2-polyprenyl-3-methyl-5-hydroxy-6-metoxy-1,4-benzoquinol methylase
MTYNYRKVLYQDYYQNQSGRHFQLQIEDKMNRDEQMFLAEILPLIPANKQLNILDIGCGFGSLIKLLKKLGYTNLKGIDLSESQVKIAHQFGMEKEVEVSDIANFLNDKNSYFDVITGIDIIEHFSKDELIDLLTIIKKSLKPGGIAIFRTPNNDAPFATVYANGDFTHENFLNCSSVTQLSLSMGFTNVEVKNSHLQVEGFLKELIRKICWAFISATIKLVLFSSARSTKNVLLSPNMIIKVQRP